MEATGNDREEAAEQYRVDYLEKKKADNTERVRRCRARIAKEQEDVDSLIIAAMKNPSSGLKESRERSTHRLSKILAK